MSDETQACCACQRVRYRTTDNGDGTVSGYWECALCGRKFCPMAERDALRAKVERLRGERGEFRSIANAAMPESLDEAEVLILAMAKKFRAYGSTISKCREAWSDALRERWGVASGAWNVTRDLALANAEAENERLLEDNRRMAKEWMLNDTARRASRDDAYRYREALEAASNALDEALGDTDPQFPPDITDEGIRLEDPVFWASRAINAALLPKSGDEPKGDDDA